ncbi:hypothetical protein J3459_016535 [Metarhizium acridum]|uniref:Allergen n=1 Tax=Metarhizium acridum (strain CQMa 102) TaxID=655827 RepID=E9EGK4_METAQ|nr:uncharacterized protein MAC_09002 [Metarhizium acridum CQMa 102]EFY84970.1 hypothetical protein MAC_09002 [Metarhizium acridum CQMa 102]KAG8411189.1 hypothetical protein J3459_016535 [Metarhizium acridum]KAG8411513.1 hypothetical protein J3458_015569 [Metarhizium acridum]
MRLTHALALATVFSGAIASTVSQEDSNAMQQGEMHSFARRDMEEALREIAARNEAVEEEDSVIEVSYRLESREDFEDVAQDEETQRRRKKPKNQGHGGQDHGHHEDPRHHEGHGPQEASTGMLGGHGQRPHDGEHGMHRVHEPHPVEVGIHDKGLHGEPGLPKQLEKRTEDKKFVVPYGCGEHYPVQHTQSTKTHHVQPTHHHVPVHHIPTTKTHVSKPTPAHQTQIYSIHTTLQTSVKPATTKPPMTKPKDVTNKALDNTPVYNVPSAVTKPATTNPAATYSAYNRPFHPSVL